MQRFSRREFVTIGLGVAALKSSPASTRPLSRQRAATDDVSSLSLSEVSKRIRAKQATSVELTQSLLDRIRTYNPKLNAYITVMRDQALAQAAQMDAEIKANRFRSPLHGIPIALKDNIDTAGTRTTAASEVFDDRVPAEDAAEALVLMGGLGAAVGVVGAVDAVGLPVEVGGQHHRPLHRRW